ncbi:MAG: YkgJ family cysteine cluster protein [Caulobacteraceae bacterium]
MTLESAEEDAMSAAPDAQRTCGSCTFCCKVFAIGELQKPVGAWCPHCAVGSGCQIYESRPRECQTFECRWLAVPQMPDAFRPDRVKTILVHEGDNFSLDARCDTANPMAWRKEPIHGFLKRYAEAGWLAGRRVTVRAGERLWLITPQEDVDLGDVPHGSRLAIGKGPDGRIKVTVSPPF